MISRLRSLHQKHLEAATELERNHHILVVDDNEAIHEDFRKILGPDPDDSDLEAHEANLFGVNESAAGPRPIFQLDFASQGPQALGLVQEARLLNQRYAMVFMDVRMPPGWDGMETAQKLWEVDPDLQVVICTAYSDRSWEEMMEKVGNPDRVLILKKPFDTIEVLQLANALTEKWFLLQASRRNQKELERTVSRRTQELLASEQRFRKLSASAPIGIFETDAAGLTTYTNPRLQRIMGLSLTDSLGDGWQRALHPDDGNIVSVWQDAAREGRDVELEFRYRTPDGAVRWVHVRSTPIRSEMGEVTGHVGSVEDITERKAIEVELARARDTALESTRLKSQFLANMSHEIRTPMNGVIGLTSLLLETALTREQLDLAETIRASADGLLTLINDILDVSKIEADKMTFDESGFELDDLVGISLDLLAERAQKKGIELAGFIQPGAPTHLRGDAGRIRQVLTNLIGNAIKFTDAGEVIVRVTCEAEDELEAKIRFEVTDTGIGIHGESQASIFEAFRQADASIASKFGGTGLGLAICKSLVEQMGGSLDLKSVPEQGACFWFTLPLPKQSTRPPRKDERLAGKRVLVVDDSLTPRQLLHEQALAWKMRSSMAASGAEALNLLHNASEAGDPYGLVVVDRAMPGMDGLALARKIKEEPAIAHSRVVLLTDFGKRISPEDLHAAGLADSLFKPVRQSALRECLAHVLQNDAAEPLTPPQPAAPRPHPERILVAEDNSVNQKVVLGQLRKLGYAADVVENGFDVLRALGEVPYDIILMDCRMPKLDGYATTERIRRDYGKPVRIIAMTAAAMLGDREECLAAGMDDYVCKPLRVAELSAALERACCGPK